jgi:hypothetical protein
MSRHAQSNKNLSQLGVVTDRVHGLQERNFRFFVGQFAVMLVSLLEGMLGVYLGRSVVIMASVTAECVEFTCPQGFAKSV